MSDFNVSYEEWLDGDFGWLRVIIKRRETGEVLSAFTEPAPRSEVLQLKKNLKGGKHASSKLEFINYFYPGTKRREEINDDLHVVKITGSIDQVIASGSTDLSFSIDSDAVKPVLGSVLRNPDVIEFRLLEMLGILAPASFMRCADEIDTAATKLAALKPLVIDVGKRAAYWDGKQLPINGGQHFNLLRAMHEASGNLVTHSNMLRAIKPQAHPPTAAPLTATSDEVREVLKRIREAFRQAGCPIRIKSVERQGYLLPTP